MKLKYIILLMLIAGEAFAAQGGFYTIVSTAAGIHPTIAKLSAGASYKIPLSSDPGPLWKSTCVDFGIDGSVTPVDYNGAAFINIEPVAIFNLKLTATLQRYHTVMEYGYQGVDSPDAPYSPSALADINGESKTAYKFSAAPMLKFRLGDMIFANTFTFNCINASTDDKYYYEPYSDSIHKKNDMDYSNSTVLLYEIMSGLLAGVQNSYSRTESVHCSSNRIAGIVIWEPETGASDRLSIGAMAGSYTENKNYSGDLYAALFVSYTMKGE